MSGEKTTAELVAWCRRQEKRYAAQDYASSHQASALFAEVATRLEALARAEGDELSVDRVEALFADFEDRGGSFDEAGIVKLKRHVSTMFAVQKVMAADRLAKKEAALAARDLSAERAVAEPYLIWSNFHGSWWRPDQRGYTLSLSSAGRYSRDEAIHIARTARGGWQDGKPPSEIALPESAALLASRAALPLSPSESRPTVSHGSGTAGERGKP